MKKRDLMSIGIVGSLAVLFITIASSPASAQTCPGTRGQSCLVGTGVPQCSDGASCVQHSCATVLCDGPGDCAKCAYCSRFSVSCTCPDGSSVMLWYCYSTMCSPCPYTQSKPNGGPNVGKLFADEINQCSPFGLFSDRRHGSSDQYSSSRENFRGVGSKSAPIVNEGVAGRSRSGRTR